MAPKNRRGYLMGISNSKPNKASLIRSFLRGFFFNRRWITFVVLILCWHFFVLAVDIDLLPTPGRVLESLREIMRSGIFFGQLGDSMVRIGLGFSLALTLGIITGVLMGSRDFWNKFFQDLIVLGLSLPGLVYALLSVMIFGIGLTAPVAAITVASLPFIAVNVREGVRSIDKDLLDMCRVYKIDRARLIRQIIIPTLIPFIMAASRIGFTVAWKVAVLTEVFGASTGIGYQMRYQFQIFSVRGIVAWALLFGLVMLVIEYGALIPMERYFNRWRPTIEKVV